MLNVHLPFSKSEINRLFILAFQSKQDFAIKNFSFCDDTQVMFDFFHQIGTKLSLKNQHLVLNSRTSKFTHNNIVNVNQAGTAFRFLLALCSFLPYNFYFQGHPSLAKRPISPLTNALSSIGIHFDFEYANQSLPLKFSGVENLSQDQIVFRDKMLSSQFLSALLLMGPSLPLHFKIVVEHKELASESYILMTLQMMEKLGIYWEYISESQKFILNKNSFDWFEYTVSADWTNASYFIALSCILKKPVFLPQLSLLSYQPDVEQLFLWTELGVQFTSLNDFDLEVNPKSFEMKSFEWDFSSMPDLFQTFAVLTAYKQGVYEFKGLQSLQYKETHRLRAIQSELSKIGIELSYNAELGTCTIKNEVSRFPEYVFFNTYHDHRMAMSLSLLKPLILKIEFDNPEVVSKSFPSYWQEYDKFFS